MGDVLAAIDLGSTRTKVLLVRPDSVTQLVVENGLRRADALTTMLDSLDGAVDKAAPQLRTGDRVVGVSMATSWPSLVVHCEDGDQLSFAYDDPRSIAAGEPAFNGGVLASTLFERSAYLASLGKSIARIETFGTTAYRHLGGEGGFDEWTALALGEDAIRVDSGMPRPDRVGSFLGVAGNHLPGAFAGAPLICGSGDTLAAGAAAGQTFSTRYYLELGTSAVLLKTPVGGAPSLVSGWPQFGRQLVDSVLSPGGADARVLRTLRDAPFEAAAADLAFMVSHSTPVINGIARLDRGAIQCHPELESEPATRRLTAALAMLMAEVAEVVDGEPVSCGGWLAEGPTFLEIARWAGIETSWVLRSSTASALALLGSKALDRDDLLASALRFATRWP